MRTYVLEFRLMAGIFTGLGVVLALLALPWVVVVELLVFGAVMGVVLHRKAAEWLVARNFSVPRPARLVMGLAAIPVPFVGVTVTMGSGVMIVAVIVISMLAFSGSTP